MKSLISLMLMLIALQQFTNTWCNAQECNFTTLAKSLIEDDENMYQLSRTFFPPVENSPEFVTVCYNFTETAEIQTWYWSTFVSNFIHPPEVMQYMSLLFTKPHDFFSGEVNISLAPVGDMSVSGCARNPERMQLLTQRLQQYALKQEHPVEIDSSYPAKAFIATDDDSDPFKRFTIEKASTLSIKGLSAATPFVTTLLSIILIIFITCLFRKSKQDHWDYKIEKRKPQIWSIAIVSLFITAYNFILSIVSVAKWTEYMNKTLYESNKPATGGPVGTLFTINFVLLCLWLFSLVWTCIRINTERSATGDPVIVANRAATVDLGTEGGGEQGTEEGGDKRGTRRGHGEQGTGEGGKQGAEGSSVDTDKKEGCCTYENCKRCIKDCTETPWYIVLSFTIFCPIISVMAHSPYIIIGYINDGHHASSIFIYYTVVICIGYAICWVGLHPQSVLRSESKRKDEDQGYSHRVGCATFIVIFVYLAIVVTITAYFVIIPINKSISDTPDRLAGIFNSGAFIIAAFVLYRMLNFFYKSSKKTGLERAIIKRAKSLINTSDAAWGDKKDHEKIDELYEVIVHIISDDYNKRQPRTVENQEPPPGADQVPPQGGNHALLPDTDQVPPPVTDPAPLPGTEPAPPLGTDQAPPPGTYQAGLPPGMDQAPTPGTDRTSPPGTDQAAPLSGTAPTPSEDQANHGE